MNAIEASDAQFEKVYGIPLLCEEAPCRLLDEDGRFKLFDGSHISMSMSPKFAEDIVAIIAQKDRED